MDHAPKNNSVSMSTSMTTYQVPTAPTKSVSELTRVPSYIPRLTNSTGKFESVDDPEYTPFAPKRLNHTMTRGGTKIKTAVITTISNFPTLVATHSKYTLVTSTIRRPPPTRTPIFGSEPGFEVLAVCNWLAPATFPIKTAPNNTTNPSNATSMATLTPTPTPSIEQLLYPPFNLSAFSSFLTALEAAEHPLPDQYQLGFKDTKPQLYWIKETGLRQDKDCLTHLFDRINDIRVSLCIPIVQQNATTISQALSLPMENITTILSTIGSDIETYQTDPSQLKGDICEWTPKSSARDPSKQIYDPKDPNEGKFQAYFIGEYYTDDRDGNENLARIGSEELPLVGWDLNIASGGNNYQKDELLWGANLQFKTPRWDLIKTTFTPTNPDHKCSDPKDFGLSKPKKRLPQSDIEKYVYPVVNSTINGLRILAEDIYASNNYDSIIRMLDEKDGDCIRRFCGGRQNLTLSICGFQSFKKFDMINAENQYANALGDRIKISEMVHFLRTQFEDAAIRHFKNPDQLDARHFGPPLREFMCSVSAVNGTTSKLPGIFSFILGPINGRKVPGCEKPEEYKEGCGNFRLEISSKPCTLFYPRCGFSQRGYEGSQDVATLNSIREARNAIEDGTITRRFAKNLIGETPSNWVRWTQAMIDDTMISFDQFYCDLKGKVKIAVGIEGQARGTRGASYEVPPKQLLRGIDVLIKEFGEIESPERISRGCSWNIKGLRPPPTAILNLTEESGFSGSVFAAQWGGAGPNTIIQEDWPWIINITRLYEDDPCESFSQIAS
ncbi:hypothetical protein TWF788_003807 [Orbilia oligospora]|uniref:Uncharacterized protein n=1 Tax=Orbilia oligospora TaxID=2813651 RepID=A0A7C8K2P9_ORBOL|nr:hypothetical protein TWF788_003807 [Orbilia oligospora]